MVTSRNYWTIDGKVIGVKQTKRGFWLTVKTKAKSELYAMDKLELNCWLSNHIAETAYKKESYLHKLHATGKFVFVKDECYFLVEMILL